jgi:hypothetical protein
VAEAWIENRGSRHTVGSVLDRMGALWSYVAGDDPKPEVRLDTDAQVVEAQLEVLRLLAPLAPADRARILRATSHLFEVG